MLRTPTVIVGLKSYLKGREIGDREKSVHVYPVIFPITGAGLGKYQEPRTHSESPMLVAGTGMLELLLAASKVTQYQAGWNWWWSQDMNPGIWIWAVTETHETS